MLQIIKEKNDFFTNVERSFDEIDSGWRTYDGMVIVGTHNPDKIPEKLQIIRVARESKIPFLGICMGMQLMAIEFAKNVLGIEAAGSQEIQPALANAVVVKMPELRVGIFPVDYDGKSYNESFWHNYKLDENFAKLFEQHFKVAYSPFDLRSGGKVPAILKLKDHPFFCGTQFHPEYQSSKDKPHPILVEFLKACKKSGNKKAPSTGA